MIAQVLAESIEIPIEHVEYLLQMPYSQLYSSPEYSDLVKTLNYETLTATLADARLVYDRYLPGLVSDLRNQHGYLGRPMTSFTLGNWLIGFLSQPHLLFKLMDIHRHIPFAVIETSLPDILEMLGKMERGGAEWKRAMAVLSLPFFAQGRPE